MGRRICQTGSLRCRRFLWARVVFIVRDRVDSPPCWMRAPGQREAWKRGKARGGRGWGKLPIPLPPHFLFCLTPTALGHFFPIPKPLSSKNPRWRPFQNAFECAHEIRLHCRLPNWLFLAPKHTGEDWLTLRQ